MGGLCYTLHVTRLMKQPDTHDRTKALLELLYHVSRELATALDLRTVLQSVLNEVLKNVGGERCSIVVLDDAGKTVDGTIVYEGQIHEHKTQQLRATVEGGLAGWVIKNRKSVYLPDTSQDPRWMLRPDDTGRLNAKSAICVPLLAREKLVGVLTLVHTKPNSFSSDQLDLMQAIADQAGIAVLNARLYTESTRQARVMTALAEGAAAMNASLRMDDVYQRILLQTVQALQVEIAVLGINEGNHVVIRAASGANAGNFIGVKTEIGKGLIGMVAREGRGVVVPDVSLEKNFSQADRFGGIEMRAFLVAPVQSQGKVMGVIVAINPVSKVFDPDAVLVLTGIGGLAGTTIQNAQFFERLQAAHKRYRELFEVSIDPIIITDWEGRILEANRQVSLLSGYSHEELHEMSIDQLHEVNWNKTGLEFEFLRGDQTITYEASLHTSDESHVPVEVHALRLEFDSTDAIQWILRDITARKELDSLREDLTSMIYHDLRSPLANIVSSLDVISDLVPEDERKTVLSILKIAENSTNRIQRLVSSLLDVSRLEAGQPVGNKTVVSPVNMIEQALSDVEPSLQGRKQEYIRNFNSHLPDIFVDDNMVLRVLINLVENASKYSPTQSNVEVGASAEDGFVHFWIKDQGAGIPQSELEHVFDKFTRLRGTGKVGGLGIGLAFCRLAVQGHGGRIWVESELEKGSTFHFTMPIATDEQLAGKPEK